MRVGLYLVPGVFAGSNLRWPNGREIVDQVKRIEDAGFASVWVGDSVGRGVMSPDGLGLLSVAAAVSSNLEVGTAILQVPLRGAFELAQRALALHSLSGARFLFGIGAGSTRADFEACGVEFDKRFDRLQQMVIVMRRLWNGGEFNGASLCPHKNVMGGPPLLIGSWGSKVWITQAAREFDGWIASARPSRPKGAPSRTGKGGRESSWEELESGLKWFRARGGGRAIVANLHLHRGADGHVHGGVGGSNGASAEETFARLSAIGFDDVVVRLDDNNKEELAWVAREAGI